MTQARRVGLIGDVHSEQRALETVLRFLAEVPDLDMLLCTGDLPGEPGIEALAACCRLLAKHDVLTVRGNHDCYFLENASDPAINALFRKESEEDAEILTYLRTLPQTRTIPTLHGPLLLCHGLGIQDTTGVYPGGEDAPIADALVRQGIVSAGIRFVIAGHTHTRMVRPVGEITMINPGTLHWGYAPGFAVIDFAERHIQFWDYAHETSSIAPAREDTL